jgi:phosphoribosylformylglycinamidine cyclo-ligase
MPLLGGETAELPGFYNEGEYDLVGSIVGIVDRDKIVDGSKIIDGDVVIGLPSVGLHTNGYSLARKICFDMAKLKFDDHIDSLQGPIGPELMKVHKSYLRPVTALLDKVPVHGMAHITGSGIPGNLVRVIPDGLQAIIDRGSWPSLPIFDYLQGIGGVDDGDMFDAFNMGIGYILVVDKNEADAAEKVLSKHDQPSHRIGRIKKGERDVRII